MLKPSQKQRKSTGKLKPNQSQQSDDEEEEELVQQMLLESSDRPEDNQELCPFPVENRLCSIYPSSCLLLSEEETIDLKLSFCLPSIKLSEIKIEVGYEELLKINLRSIEFKPEAPWIVRN